MLGVWRIRFWLAVAGLGQWLLWRAASGIRATVYSSGVEVTYLPYTQWRQPPAARAD